MFVVGARIAAVEKIPVGAADVAAQRPAESHARFLHFAPLLADFFALFLAQRHQEIVEIAEGARRICPVKLHRVAQHQTSFFAGAHILVGGKQQV